MLNKSIARVVVLSQFMTSFSPGLASGSGSGMQDLKETATRPSRPNPLRENSQQWDDIRRLWHSGDEQQAQHRLDLRQSALNIAYASQHICQWEAIEALWNSGDQQQAKNRHALGPVLLQIAYNLHHIKCWNAIEILWDSEDEQQADIRNDLYSHLLDIAYLPHPTHTLKAIQILWRSREENHTQLHAELRPVLENLAQSEPSQQGAVSQFLWESPESVAQDLGLALYIRYFSQNFSLSLQSKMASFNQGTFKAHARPPLEDLSHENIDLVGEMTALMTQINAIDESSPYYLEASAITGHSPDHPLSSEENQRTIQDIQQRARGFLKSLTGQPLEEGEEAGWQMYEENKPALINALKHVLYALNREEDPQIRLNNLGIVLNGILCQAPVVRSRKSFVPGAESSRARSQIAL